MQDFIMVVALTSFSFGYRCLIEAVCPLTCKISVTCVYRALQAVQVTVIKYHRVQCAFMPKDGSQGGVYFCKQMDLSISHEVIIATYKLNQNTRCNSIVMLQHSRNSWPVYVGIEYGYH